MFCVNVFFGVGLIGTYTHIFKPFNNWLYNTIYIALNTNNMEKYLVILWYKTGCKEFSLISDRYPIYRDVISASGISESDVIDYEIHY
jgi:hypothetical protein